jgi:16S rRNA (adenine1518-N6/adenine1519-N6)-dimethyltransferase
VARTCFAPPPNVDSALVAFRRTRDWGPELARVREVVQAAFAHRRKTLANSLELTGLTDRERAVAALGELGRPASVRAEALEPDELLRLAELLP